MESGGITVNGLLRIGGRKVSVSGAKYIDNGIKKTIGGQSGEMTAAAGAANTTNDPRVAKEIPSGEAIINLAEGVGLGL